MLGIGIGIATLSPARPAAVDLDFVANRYIYRGGLWPLLANLPAEAGWSYTRSNPATAARSNGFLQAFAADVPRITDQGLLLETSRTNRSVGPNANPTTTTGITTYGDAARLFTLEDDPAALAAAGLNTVCTSGKVFRLNNTAGATPAYAVMNGTTGNLNQQIQSIYARGSGNYSVGLDAGVDSGGFGSTALTGSYVRRFGAAGAVPTTTGAALRVAANAGADVWFILWNLVTASSVASPVITTGTALTVGEDEPRINVPPGVSRYIIDYVGGQATGSVTPGDVFDFSPSAIPALAGKIVTRLRMV